MQTILTFPSATALATLTLVWLSLTLVAVRWRWGQFSPRIVRSILHDRRSQLAIGLFIGTFRLLDDRPCARSTATALAAVSCRASPSVVDYGLILSAIVVLVARSCYHTAQSIRAGGLIGSVADATCDEVDRLYPAALRARGRPERDPRRPTTGSSPSFRTSVLVGP